MITLSWTTIAVGSFVLLSAGCCFGVLLMALLNAAAAQDREAGLK